MRKTNFRLIAGLALATFAYGAGSTEISNDWTEAISSTYKQSNVKHEGNSVTSSVACFDATIREGERCKLIAFLHHDAFRKTRFYTPTQTRLSGYRPEPYLRSEVVLLDCKKPSYLLQPYYFSKRDGLRMHTVAVKLDGKVVYEKSFPTEEVQRTSESHGIEEITHLIADEKTLVALRQIAKGGKTTIRLAGEKSSAMVPPKEAEKFGLDVAHALEIYDKLNAAITPDTQKSCLAAR